MAAASLVPLTLLTPLYAYLLREVELTIPCTSSTSTKAYVVHRIIDMGYGGDPSMMSAGSGQDEQTNRGDDKLLG